jgi:Tol biopolymer transport system component
MSLPTLVLATLFSAGAFAQIDRISVGPAGEEADRDSYQAAISDDGEVVAFRSNSDLLDPADSNGLPDIFVRDLGTDSTERVSPDFTPGQLQLYNQHVRTTISDDGNLIAFQATPNAYAAIRLHDRAAGTTVEILPLTPLTNLDAEARQRPALSGDGQWIAFHSQLTFQSSEPVSARPANDDVNGAHDIFVYDLGTVPTPPTERVSRDATGVEGDGDSYAASLSDDGRFVAFHSHASNLVPGDNNLHEDVFVKDRGTNAIERASVSSAEVQANDESVGAAISGDGRYVAFRSRATNLVAGDTNGRWDIFVRDLDSGTTERVSVASDGSQGNHDSVAASISDDGRYVAFESMASNLVADDTNARADIFVHDRTTGQTARVSIPAGGGEADGHSHAPAISGDGTWIVFESDATDLVAGDTNQSRDVFRVANPL